LALLCLAACQRGDAVRTAPDSIAGRVTAERCGAAALDALTGRPFTALAGIALPGDLRVLRPAQPVTRDLDPSRLNAQVDRQGRILRLFCG
jgi:hypothetical protein